MRNLYATALVLCNFLTLVTTNVAWSEDGSTKPPFVTELGFKRLTDPSTPSILKKAAQSVYEIRSLSGDSADDLRQFDLTDPKYADIETKIDGIRELDDKEKLIIKKQIQVCRRNGSEKECLVFFSIEKGTAFLAGDDSSMLWTNAHLVTRFLKLRATFAKKTVPEQIKEDPRVGVFVFDQNGKLVFDPYDNIANIANYSGEISIFAKLRGDWYAEDTDFVGIKLDRPIGVPLKIGPKPKPDQNLYRPGFAACTGCAENPNTTDPLENISRGLGKDSDGQGLYWTAGKAVKIDHVINFLDSTIITALFKLDQMIFFNADSQVGFSGGPILNEAGEVVGVFAGSKPRMYGKDMVVLSRGVRPPAFNE